MGAGHVGAPDGVDAEVFVEDHEEVVEPALAEPFVSELGEGVRGGGGGGVLGRRGVSFRGGYGGEGMVGRGERGWVGWQRVQLGDLHRRCQTLLLRM